MPSSRNSDTDLVSNSDKCSLHTAALLPHAATGTRHEAFMLRMYAEFTTRNHNLRQYTVCVQYEDTFVDSMEYDRVFCVLRHDCPTQIKLLCLVPVKHLRCPLRCYRHFASTCEPNQNRRKEACGRESSSALFNHDLNTPPLFPSFVHPVYPVLTNPVLRFCICNSCRNVVVAYRSADIIWFRSQQQRSCTIIPETNHRELSVRRNRPIAPASFVPTSCS